MAKSSTEPVLPRIHTIRKLKVVQDAELARLYGVPTMRLNEAVKRNAARFPREFSFVLTREEHAALISQIAISKGERSEDSGSQIAILKSRRGGTRKPARVFTSNLAVLRRLAEIDKKLIEHDVVLSEVVKRLQPLLNPPREKPKPKIGFHRGNR